MYQLIIILLSVFSFSYAAEKFQIQKAPPLWVDPLPDCDYFPEQFYTFSTNPSQSPLMTGPCSPCCVVYLTEPVTQHTVGLHITACTDFDHMIHYINNKFSSQSNVQPSFVMTLFSSFNQQAHQSYQFRNGSHKEWINALCNRLHQTYTIAHADSYINEADESTKPADRWVIYMGLDTAQKPRIYRLNPLTVFGIKYLHFTAYDAKLYADMCDSIKTFHEWSKAPILHETHDNTLAKIKPTISDVSVYLFTDGLIVPYFFDASLYRISIPIGNLPKNWITPKCTHSVTTSIRKLIQDRVWVPELINDSAKLGQVLITIIQEACFN